MCQQICFFCSTAARPSTIPSKQIPGCYSVWQPPDHRSHGQSALPVRWWGARTGDGCCRSDSDKPVCITLNQLEKLTCRSWKSCLFFVAFNLAKRRAPSRILHYTCQKQNKKTCLTLTTCRICPDIFSERSPPIQFCRVRVVVGGGVMCFPLDTQIPLCEEEVAGWEWLAAPQPILLVGGMDS